MYFLNFIFVSRPATTPPVVIDTGLNEEEERPEEVEEEVDEDSYISDESSSTTSVQSSSSSVTTQRSSGTSEKPSTLATKSGTTNKRKRKTKSDRIAESMSLSVDRFLEEQKKAECRFVEFEEKRMKLEEEADIRHDRMTEQRQREEREHEYRMSMIMQTTAGRQMPQMHGMMPVNPLETRQAVTGRQIPQLHVMMPVNPLQMGENLMSEIPSSSSSPPSYFQLP